MVHPVTAQLPPLQGCLYCHAEGTTAVVESRRWLGLGSHFPILKCSHCGSTALFDYDPDRPEDWRVCYRRVNTAPRYYYVALYLGRAGWLSAPKALHISTNGYVQRMRVSQAKAGELDWLPASPIHPPPPLMRSSEKVYLTLKAVSLHMTPPPGFWVRAEQGAMLDSGKFYVTDQQLHLLGQRRDWSLPFAYVSKVEYNEKSWVVYVNMDDQSQHFRGTNTAEQFDAQLVSAVIETLWHTI
jgi:hypothetical protein